tara:strand:+ start:2932 stop:3378 length:447 start_codon:yes stop_codon:yes gene_type:complete
MILAIAASSAFLALSVTWLSLKAVTTEYSSANRLIAELRLAQISSLLLVLVSGIYVGGTLLSNEAISGSFEIAFASGFFIIACLATTYEPSTALKILATSWIAHSILDVAHVKNFMDSTILPPWYPFFCSLYDIYIALVCLIPVAYKK